MEPNPGTPFTDAVARTGGRVTLPRRRIAELITARDGAFTSADLLADAAAAHSRLGRATVFRTLERFVELGLVERLDLPSGAHAYVRCEPAHHHHVVCTRCGRSTDVGDFGVGEAAGEIARRTGYRIDGHRFELFGVCPECAGRAPETVP